MSEGNVDARPLTSVELLDAAVWREIDSEEAQPAAAFWRAIALGWAVARGAFRRPRNGCCDCAVQGEELYRTPGSHDRVSCFACLTLEILKMRNIMGFIEFFEEDDSGDWREQLEEIRLRYPGTYEDHKKEKAVLPPTPPRARRGCRPF